MIIEFVVYYVVQHLFGQTNEQTIHTHTETLVELSIGFSNVFESGS